MAKKKILNNCFSWTSQLNLPPYGSYLEKKQVAGIKKYNYAFQKCNIIIDDIVWKSKDYFLLENIQPKFIVHLINWFGWNK